MCVKRVNNIGYLSLLLQTDRVHGPPPLDAGSNRKRPALEPLRSSPSKQPRRVPGTL